MLLRSALCLCLASGICLAANPGPASDPIQTAIQQAMPSPSSGQIHAGKGMNFSPRQLEQIAKTQVKVKLQTDHTCAIPLTSVPIPKGRSREGITDAQQKMPNPRSHPLTRNQGSVNRKPIRVQRG